MSKAKKKNPLPCGCAAKGVYDWASAHDDGECLNVPMKDIRVAHCPLHAAAPGLLAACQSVLTLLNGLGGSDELGDFYAARVDEEDAKLRAAIAKATGDTA